jgi:hypothetical protein
VNGARAAWRRPWNAARMLRVLLGTQCALALLVVAGDLPDAVLGALPKMEPAAPATEIPVSPGDQTRRFEPRRLPVDRPESPGFPLDQSVAPRLTFEEMTVGSRRGLLLSGAIEAGDARRFAAHLAATVPPPEVIALHSPGGLVDEALQIGRAIRDSGLPVAVTEGASCFSACPYILAGGVEREVSRAARVGVHQHYFGESSFLPAFLAVSDVQAGQAEVMTYLDDMGIDPMLMQKALITPPEDIYILLPEELTGYRLATVLAD